MSAKKKSYIVSFVASGPVSSILKSLDDLPELVLQSLNIKEIVEEQTNVTE